MMDLASRWPQLAAYFSDFKIPVAIVDLESTGGNLYADRVTEIAVLRFENGMIQRYEWLVNPKQSISQFITALTGIDNAMVADAPAFADLSDTLLPLLRCTLLIAHNSRFDYTFLRHEFQRIGVSFAAPTLCTVQLSRRLYPQFHKHNLDSIIQRFDIDAAQRHRAMTDVMALADFLEKSLAEKGTEEWERHFHSLIQPKILPAWLPVALSQQIYALPDSYGVSIWRDKKGNATSMHVHEKAFSEIAASLQNQESVPFIREISDIQFIPALGKLHALYQKAQLATEHASRPSEKSSHYLTVQFTTDECSRLQAKIVSLSNGCMTHPPTGLFLHKKSAKRALTAWANEYGLCPSSLNILPTTHAHNVPCPVQEIGRCSGHCHTESGIETQNRKILEHAPSLPVADWGKARKVEVVESDVLSGREIVLNCEGGALELPDGRWYFDHTLPALLKEKFKSGKNAVHIIKAV
ncbi:DNA polymerase III subunit [Neisseria zoodegmatis]|uniref:DNA polymerase III subunit n=1 Tax=Neisseria zoodegmatis TaxID=326523 RepID=A0A378WJH8_9NEIS|nr:3'-5' exonuclease [Neisseria zoodegmatis]SUA36623.1 DNA polymerase III subunit [Neisseria zoodegmatis]